MESNNWTRGQETPTFSGISFVKFCNRVNIQRLNLQKMFNIDIRVEEMKYTNHSEKKINKYIFSFMCNFTGTSIQTQCARPNALHFDFYLECVIIFSEDYKNMKP